MEMTEYIKSMRERLDAVGRASVLMAAACDVNISDDDYEELAILQRNWDHERLSSSM
jgi:hypothetical protein